MAVEDEALKALRAQFERDPQINLHRDEIRMEFADGLLVLDGQVRGIGAKRRVLELAAPYAKNGITDRLRVIPAEPKADGAIRDAIINTMLEELALRNCALRVWHGEKEETIRDTQPESSGDVYVFVEDGIVILEGWVLSLSHRRLAGVIAWWAPGCRDVVNKLTITPAEEDSDAEISDAVRMILEKDRLLPADQISIATQDREVTLEGLVFRDSEKEKAEMDTWYVDGVKNVLNRIEVQR
jgi:osmotically-inducible protein OsmY